MNIKNFYKANNPENRFTQKSLIWRIPAFVIAYVLIIKLFNFPFDVKEFSVRMLIIAACFVLYSFVPPKWKDKLSLASYILMATIIVVLLAMWIWADSVAAFLYNQ